MVTIIIWVYLLPRKAPCMFSRGLYEPKVGTISIHSCSSTDSSMDRWIHVTTTPQSLTLPRRLFEWRQTLLFTLEQVLPITMVTSLALLMGIQPFLAGVLTSTKRVVNSSINEEKSHYLIAFLLCYQIECQEKHQIFFNEVKLQE